MDFKADNPVVRLCLQGMAMEEKGQPEEAGKIFHQAWNEAAQGYEKFMSAFFIARQQTDCAETTKWLETAMGIATELMDDTVKSAMASLHASLSQCYEELGNPGLAEKHRTLVILAEIHFKSFLKSTLR